MTTSHHTWGGRFKKALDPAVVSFNASLPFDYILYPYDILGSQAHAAMLAQQRLLTEEENQAIQTGLDDIKAELDQGLHSFENLVHEDIHMLIEHLLIQKIGDAGKKLHTGRSRNDQVALDLRLFTRASVEEIHLLLSQLQQALQDVVTLQGGLALPGYTHLQQAQPITLELHLTAYAAMFSRDQERLQDCLKRLNKCPLGAGALAGSSLPLDREFVAAQLGFENVISNTMDAVSDRDFIIEFLSAASLIMVHLSRLCEDFILWATTEFGFITLDDAFATGSSLMPNKKNPDVLELIRGKSGRVIGHLMGFLTLMKGLPMSYNKDLQEDKEGLFDTVITLRKCLAILPAFLKSLTFNQDKMQTGLQQGLMNAALYAEELVLKGVPFREAHHVVGEWVAQALASNTPLSHIAQTYFIQFDMKRNS